MKSVDKITHPAKKYNMSGHKFYGWRVIDLARYEFPPVVAALFEAWRDRNQMSLPVDEDRKEIVSADVMHDFLADVDFVREAWGEAA